MIIGAFNVILVPAISWISQILLPNGFLL